MNFFCSAHVISFALVFFFRDATNPRLEFSLVYYILVMYQQTTKEEIRTVCSSLKQLESEAAYKLQVLACGGNATAECGDSIGPASAILHFTTQTNRKSFTKMKKKSNRFVCVSCFC